MSVLKGSLSERVLLTGHQSPLPLITGKVSKRLFISSLDKIKPEETPLKEIYVNGIKTKMPKLSK